MRNEDIYFCSVPLYIRKYCRQQFKTYFIYRIYEYIYVYNLQIYPFMYVLLILEPINSYIDAYRPSWRSISRKTLRIKQIPWFVCNDLISSLLWTKFFLSKKHVSILSSMYSYFTFSRFTFYTKAYSNYLHTNIYNSLIL